ncbi:MAG: nuclear transport factor 2 family protein [Burkholderiales bacterium]|nr:MAG: nuclear transport factor 2 family protein [Burkholderiales bacterium]
MNPGISQDAARAAVDRVCTFYEGLNPQSLADIGALYAPQARFKDPFNEVHGVPAITRIFEHMFDNLHEPRFVVTRRLVDGGQAFLVWEFRFRFKRFHPDAPQVIHGGSHLVLAPDGRVCDHRDYWDAAEELYEKLPAIGALMRWLRRRVNG